MVLSHWVFSGWRSQLLSGTNCSSYSSICKELQIVRNCFNPLWSLFSGHKKERARARDMRASRVRVPVLSCTHRELSNYDADGNGNGKKAISLISKTTTLHMHHAFLYISLPSLPDYNVKVPEFTFCRGRGHKTTTFFSFPELWYSPLEFNSKNICQHLTK